MQNVYKMVSDDIKSLFTNVPLDRIISIILKKIYDNAELQTTLTRSGLKELLLVCTQKVHFTLTSPTYKQAVLLGPAVADRIIKLEI